MIYFILIINLFFSDNICMENEEPSSLNELNKLYEDFNKKCLPHIEDAYKFRLNKNENENEKKKLFYLYEKEAESEKIAYRNFFNIEDDKRMTTADVLKNILNKTKYISSTIIKSFQLEEYKFISNTYWDCFIETDNDRTLKEFIVCTDAHSSKELLTFSKYQKIFCGDIAYRQLTLANNKSEESEENQQFYIMKHFFFIDAQLLRSAETYQFLFFNNNKSSLKSIKNINILGNHDLYSMMINDLYSMMVNDVKKDIPKEYRNSIEDIAMIIHNTTTQITPIEVVIKNSNEGIFVFSHSGATYTYPKMIEKKKIKHQDFIATRNKYNFEEAISFKNKELDGISEETMKNYITPITQIIKNHHDQIKDNPKKNYLTHPNCWCDMFTEENRVSNSKGRIILPDITTTNTLKYIQEILLSKYTNEIGNDERKHFYICRGHEHETKKLCCFIDENKKQYNFALYESTEQKISLTHLPPHGKDNKYFEYFSGTGIDPYKMKQPSIEEIIKKKGGLDYKQKKKIDQLNDQIRQLNDRISEQEKTLLIIRKEKNELTQRHSKEIEEIKKKTYNRNKTKR